MLALFREACMSGAEIWQYWRYGSASLNIEKEANIGAFYGVIIGGGSGIMPVIG